MRKLVGFFAVILCATALQANFQIEVNGNTGFGNSQDNLKWENAGGHANLGYWINDYFAVGFDAGLTKNWVAIQGDKILYGDWDASVKARYPLQHASPYVKAQAGLTTGFADGSDVKIGWNWGTHAGIDIPVQENWGFVVESGVTSHNLNGLKDAHYNWNSSVGVGFSF